VTGGKKLNAVKKKQFGTLLLMTATMTTSGFIWYAYQSQRHIAFASYQSLK
jgi:hypothetical protein